ncbi:MAG: ABC transporter substrate-binding protein [Alphaproteobacteria bacterium]|nr:ABC transporter substrate-binding protein [Alphaproteobacteria bacterium]
MAISRALPALALALVLAAPAAAQEKVVFGTNWKAQPEHGGYYHAVAEGIYKRYGLDVTIRPGGPQVNHSQLLAAGKIDFNMGSALNGAFNYVQNKVPVNVVAAIFQRDPQVFIAHPGQGNDTLQALKGKPILISQGARLTYWPWMKVAFGYTDDQIRVYTFNPAPFLADKAMVQQSYMSSEPYKIKQLGGFEPVVIPFYEYGWDTYATTIECLAKWVIEKPDTVQRFVNATIEGWYGYLYGDPAKAHVMIKQDNPDMTDDQIAFSRDALKRYGIVDSGDAKTMGIGAMTEARWSSFFKKMADAGVFPADLDWRQAMRLQFVNKKVGM